MNIFKLSLITLLACITISCSTDSNFDEDENLLLANANAELIGTWTGIDVSYTGTITTQTGGVTTVQNIEGTNFSGTYTITFTQDPNVVTGEGLYSISQETSTSDDESSTQTITNLNLINSFTNWNLVDNELTMEASGKTTIADITELTTNTLVLTINENITSTINEVTETVEKSSVFSFTR